MITISIDPEGGITLSQESAGERAVMSDHYANQEAATSETELDEMRAAFFKSGWESATREAMHHFVAGRLVEYFQEIGVAKDLAEAHEAHEAEVGAVDPHHNEPEGMGEALTQEQYFGEDLKSDPDFEDNWTQTEWEGRDEVLARAEEGEDPTPVIAVVAEDPDIRPVVDSGEPLVEAEPVKQFENGVWTMSDEELQSRLDETYNRGRRDGELSGKPIQTTERTIQMMASEVNAKLWPEGYGNLSKRDVLSQFGVELAKRFGIEVSA